MTLKIKPIFMGILRHVLTLIAGFIVANGLVSQDTAQGGVGIILGLIGMLWSAQDKQRPAPMNPTDVVVEQRVQIPPDPPEKPPKVVPQLQQIPLPPSTTIQSGFELSERSLKNLQGVHPTLCEIVKLALSISRIDFVVIEGLRSTERQQALLKEGKSWVKRSAHQDGIAVDLMALPADKTDNWLPEHYTLINEAMQEAALRLKARLTWGGHWKVRDYVHFQLEGC